MREILDALRRWSDEGRDAALATVVRMQGSAPRPPGTTMAIAADGEMWGSVSGGCVENDVSLHAREVLDAGEPRLVSYGIADDDAFEVGLACGGTIEVFIRPARGDIVAAIGRLVTDERLGATAMMLEGAATGEAVLDAGASVIAGGLPEGAAAAVAAGARDLMEHEKAAVLESGDLRVFVAPIAPSPHLVVFGAVHIAQPLTSMARLAGFRVTVTDPRAAFATTERFPDADTIVVAWPDALGEEISFDRRTYGVILNHDARHEDPVLIALLRSEARYIGAMGSRRTHAARLARLAAEGFDEAALARIHGPVGLDIGAEAPAEVAVSILAEMIRERYGAGTASSLRDRTGPIHAGRGD
jgi:xanthine dehydrogenase accessory factor